MMHSTSHALLCAQDDELWHILCDVTWSKCTDVLSWVQPAEESTSSQDSVSCPSKPATFRDAYILLHHVQDLVGLWRIIGEGRKGSLVNFFWEEDSLVGEALVHRSIHCTPEKDSFYRVYPSTESITCVEWGENHESVALLVNEMNGEENSRPGTPSRSVAIHRPAVCCAEVGFGTPRSSAIMGESPDGSFKSAWSQFMSSNVMKRAKMRRKPSRHSMALQNIRHLKRVQIPEPTKRHPLSGLWICEIEKDSFEIISIRYSFKDNVAAVVAEKLCGPGCASPGECIWNVVAACRTDWSGSEIDLFSEMLHIRRSDTYGSEPSNAIDTNTLELRELHLEDSDSMDESNSATQGSVEQLPSSMHDIVGYHVGHSKYFGLEDDDADEHGWYPCRLYVFNKDSFTMMFVDNQDVISFKRLQEF